MDIQGIAIVVLVVVGIWAVAELALTLRCVRRTAEVVDRTVGEVAGSVNETIGEARPVIAKLDEALDDLSPAMVEVEPLIKQGNVALEALSADLLEINGVLRDVSGVTGAANDVASAVSGAGKTAASAVSRLMGHRGAPAAGAAPERTLEPSAAGDATDPVRPDEDPGQPASEEGRGGEPSSRYYTYGAAEPSPQASPASGGTGSADPACADPTDRTE